MRTHVALLRGVNVGGHGKLPMADLRAVAGTLGWHDAATYIQSGNLVFGYAGARSGAELAADLSAGLDAECGFAPPAVVLTADQWNVIHASNPFAAQQNPRAVHATVHQEPVAADRARYVAQCVALAGERGSPDEAVVLGRVIYLHTPDGLGRSVLAQLLAKRGSQGTTRNWATVSRLRELLGSADSPVTTR